MRSHTAFYNLPFHTSLWSHSLIAFILLTLFQSHITHTQAQHIVNFTKKDYNASSQNWSVDFDQDGNIYFGNSTSLLQFDGIWWKAYPSPNSGIIRAVATNLEGKVFTAGYRELGYWERDAHKNLEYHSLTHLIASHFDTNEEFWNILSIKDKIVFHSFSGLYIYNKNQFKTLRPGGFINFATRVNNTIYISILNRGIYKLVNDTLEIVVKNDILNNKMVRFIANGYSPNTLYVGTKSEGLFLYDLNNNTLNPVFSDFKSFFSENQINHGLVTDQGNLVIGTILNGVIALSPDGKEIYHFNKENGLKGNTVLGMGIDKLSNIWLALDTGIDFIPGTLNQNERFFLEEEIGAVYSAALLKDKLYIGTNQGLYVKPWKNKDSKFELINNTQGHVWDCKIIDDKLFACHNEGTFVLGDNKKDKLCDFTGTYCVTLHPEDRNTLIQGTYNELLVLKKKHNQWQFSNTIKGFNNLIRYLEFDHLGNLWASHAYMGIYKLRLNEKMDRVVSIKHYPKLDSISHGTVNPRAFKIEGRIVIANGTRLYTYDDLNDSIVPYKTLNKHLGEFRSAHRIITAPNHHYWFINKSGLACFYFRADKIELIKYYPASVFQNNLIPTHENVVQVNDSNIVVCMGNGFAVLNPYNKSEGNEIGNHELKLKNTIIYDRFNHAEKIDLTEHPTVIPNRKNNLKLSYSFPLINGDPVYFQYRVEGLSDQWSELTEKPEFELTRIPPGDYTIQVKAKNNWLKDSKVSTIHITVNKAWYQRRGALISYFILIVFILIFLRRISIRKVKLREKRIREHKEKQLVTLRNEKLRSELSHKSQQLATSTMGVIKKNEFLLSLKTKIKKQKEALGTRFPDKYYQDLTAMIDDNISGQDDWKIFESNFEKAHEAFLQNLKVKHPDLTPSDLRLCAFLRINLTSKDIAPLLGISVRGVENHRYRVRKKLDLSPNENLTDYILNL